jgi:hypothetical protein
MENIAVVESIVPSVLFAGTTLVFALFFWFRYRMRHDMHQTIRTAIEKGQELSPEIIDRMGEPKPSRNRDIRLALIWVAAAAGIAGFGVAMGGIEPEVRQVMSGIAAFPFCIGIAYGIMWRFAGRES